MLTFRPSATTDRPIALPAYFQETVFLTAAEDMAGRSFFLKVFKTDFHKAEDVARLFLRNGARLAARMKNPNFSTEDGIVALIDMQRKKLGVPVNKSVHYRNGDMNRLWPGLHFYTE